MNHLDQLVRDTLAERADDAPHAGAVISRAVEDASGPRRRLALVAASVSTAAAAAAAVATAIAVQSPEETPVADAPAAGPGGGVLERCLDLGAEAMPGQHWGAGSRVLTSATAGDRSRAVLISADGSQWADCQLLGAGQGIVSTYPIEPARQGSTEFSSAGATDGSTFTMAERFPENVDRVRLVFDSGKSYAADAVDGFVVFELAGSGLDGLDKLLQYDASGTLVGGPGLAPGDADLPVGQRTLVPDTPLDSVTAVENQ